MQVETLMAMMDDPDCLAWDRAKAGRQLAEMGDPRPGIGVDTRGVPDMAWCLVDNEGGTPIGGDSDSWLSLPAQTVTIPTFWMARYPITHAQFEAFVTASDGYYQDRAWWEGLGWEKPKHAPASQPYANHPRDTLNWYECVAFCRWLTHRLQTLAGEQPDTGAINDDANRRWEGLRNGTLVARLPTQQEWEKAARGRAGWFYGYQSNDLDPKRMNIWETGIRRTSAVGLFSDSPSPYGVMDLSGNIAEWVLTAFEADGTDSEEVDARMTRGGSYAVTDNRYTRAASRYVHAPDARSPFTGGRVVLAEPVAH